MALSFVTRKILPALTEKTLKVCGVSGGGGCSRNCHSAPVIKEETETTPDIYCNEFPIRTRGPRPNLISNLNKKMATAPKFENVVESESEIREELMKFNSGEIRLSKNDETGVALLKLSNQERKNALSGKMMVELRDIVVELESWKNGKALLVHSNGDCFCSGMDLTMIKEKSDQAGGDFLASHLQETLNRLQALPLVTAALVQGRAMGGGAELVTAFDFRLFAPKAEVRFVHSRMGVSTGIAGGGTRLVRLIGPTLALKYLLSAEVIGAERALEIGLASVVFEQDENLMDSAIQWLKPLISNRACDIVQSVKKIVYNASNLPTQDALRLEKDIFVSSWGAPALLSALHDGLKHK